MGPGTLYGSIQRMLTSGLIEEVARTKSVARGAPDDDERRRYYRLTVEGRRALDAEVQRYARVVAVAQDRDLLAPA